jgi:hypothetical protein
LRRRGLRPSPRGDGVARPISRHVQRSTDPRCKRSPRGLANRRQTLSSSEPRHESVPDRPPELRFVGRKMKSHARASSVPPPRAKPFTCAMKERGLLDAGTDRVAGVAERFGRPCPFRSFGDVCSSHERLVSAPVRMATMAWPSTQPRRVRSRR